jgi:teichoic acid transport system permease protein
MSTVQSSDPNSPAALARAHGLAPMGLRPSLPTYIGALWQRRFFAWTFARSRIVAENNESRLGQLWQVLNPLFNAAVYYLVFGVILGGSETIENFPAFLIIGVFIFTFTQKTIMSASRSVTGSLGLVRALNFPRAVLPVAVVTEEFLKLTTSLAVLAVIVLLTGEPLTWSWLLLVPSLALQAMFTIGVGFVFARLTSQTRDVAQFLPFALRIWLYLSGVMYSIPDFVARKDLPSVIEWLLIYNPAAIFIELARHALMVSVDVDPWLWLAAVLWAVAALVVGFVFFWRAEARYGRG